MNIRTFFRSVSAILLLGASYSLSAQSINVPTQTFQVGFGTGSKGLELSYEYRPAFVANRVLGFRTFLGYGLFAVPKKAYQFSTYHINFSKLGKGHLPIQHQEVSLGGEVNFLLGSYNHAGEMGIGTALDWFSKKVNYFQDWDAIKAKEILTGEANPSSFASHSYIRVGYRYTHDYGFTLGVGGNFLLLQGLGTKFFASEWGFTPYISIGYTM
ncbi:hypothetical protein [Porphyromonas sp. COT-108 OH1349]|uniref:hypothetical protein n=1 Tax=Porphyromonas sp. COT-108 OH1349 TaxID=1537504 RepID=UPI00052C370E|nr:hypothetical protein [Porphyromonas sp. COT-108 OH1349]KGN69627.1 hypothetical protein JT26_05300 [Porphyromonas sp. COT-108 OH1349]